MSITNENCGVLSNAGRVVRKTKQQRQAERRDVLELRLQGVPRLEIQYRLGLSKSALTAYLAELVDCVDGQTQQFPSYTYEVLLVTSLPEEAQKPFYKSLDRSPDEAADLYACIDGTLLVKAEPKASDNGQPGILLTPLPPNANTPTEIGLSETPPVAEEVAGSTYSMADGQTSVESMAASPTVHG